MSTVWCSRLRHPTGVHLEVQPVSGFSNFPSFPSGRTRQVNGLLIDSIRLQRSFAMREKGCNRLVPGPDYMVDALKLPNQAPRGYGESLQTCVAWRCPGGTQHLFCWQFWPFLFNS
ncbi:hypothetical protein TNCV_2607611 [Trichonephila clavipes]|uniref:Uncharacterized protein n=1 Tax=Trichonephila clavipes TaxID=2585209 RepID=A0A8X6RTN3_TRICX|nr:hypothetical protein TNCV_2607611 [Trichonephila clavipes]